MIRTLKQKKVYENKWLRLNEDDVEFPDGKKGIFTYVDRVDEGSIAVPMTNDGKLVILREWRYAVKDWTWCFPAGGAKYPGEDRLEVAKKELKEEAGMVAKEWAELGRLQIDPGSSSQNVPVFLAQDL